MIKSQFIIIGVLSLIAVVATTSTVSAYALLKAQDVVGIANDVANGKSIDTGKLTQQANPLNDKSVKDLANKIDSSIDVGKILGQTGTQNPSDIGSSIPLGSLGQ